MPNTDDSAIEKLASATDTETTPAPAPVSGARNVFEFIEMFVVAITILLFFFSFFVRQAVVEGDSMKCTLESGERLLISDFFYTPKNGDIVVFQSSVTGRPEPLVKRIIATEGQTVRIEKNGVYVDDAFLAEPYAYYCGDPRHTYRDGTFARFGREYTVPEGYVFVLGDHRDDSHDSRNFGFVEEDAILGRVILRLTPFSRFGAVN